MTAPAQRLDKWLWFARCARTRSACQKLVQDGRVRINGARTRANAASVKPGDVLTLTLSGRIRILKVLAAGDKRGNAAAAAELFEDLSPTLPRPDRPPTALEQAIRAPGAGRPTKRDRRRIERLRGSVRNPVPGGGE